MPPVLEQSAYNSVAKYQSRTATATFNKPSKPGSLLVVAASYAGALPVGVVGPPGFTLISDPGLRDVEMGVWYQQNAPSTTSVTVGFHDATERSIQMRVLEYSGMAQANVLDKIVIRQNEDNWVDAGRTGTTAQADELVLAFVANQYASTAQYGFSGSLTRLYENTSPQTYFFGVGWNEDWERSRLTVHQAIATTPGDFTLTADLSTTRRWLSTLITFKGASSGPARFTSTKAPALITTGGTGTLTAFGPLVSKNAPPMIVMGGGKAIVGPFNYQYRLGGFGGLLIGSGTEILVQSSDGLGGWQVRTSDDDLPRGDGALRGIDLETARQVMFKVSVGSGRDEVERNMDILMRSLVPQRDADFELIWRHPTQPLKMMRVRPVDLTRHRNSGQLMRADQSFTLRAADPRHYSAIPHSVKIPVSPDNGDPVITRVTNIGNSAAYPVITITGPTSGPPVTRIELVNATALITFDVALTLPTGSVLIGDMDARITGAPRSIITLDGVSKYGSWQLPRDPFHLNADPSGLGGYNSIYLRTTPVGAPITATLDYRDTWAG